MERKKSKGRQKIEMVKIEKESSLQAAFSKRRSSLMKKANELCTLAGAKIALIIYSPGNKVFSFGSPSVESVLQRFKFQTPEHQPCPEIERLHQIYRETNLEKLNQRIKFLQGKIEAEKTRGAMLDQIMELDEKKYLWDGSVDDANLDQLEKLKAVFLDIHDKAKTQLGNLVNSQIQREPFPELWKSNGPSGFTGSFQFNWAASSSSSGGGIDLNFPAEMNSGVLALPRV